MTGNDITIDLNGFTITSNGSGAGITDGENNLENIVIRNGTIRNFTQGIWIDMSDGCRVESVTAINNGAGIIVGNHCQVSNNIAINNRNAGILTGSDCSVSYNIVNNNNTGITLNLTNVRSNFLYNTTNGNLNQGLSVVCPSNVVGNIAQNNGTNFLEQVGKCKTYNSVF